MASTPSPPDVRSLLPPLLACLPAASASPSPPPALLSLLSPILRQRVQLLSPNTDPTAESWLSLLCWDGDAAGSLPSVVAGEAFELHPVSGEIEYGEVDPIEYRRLDEDTLQARIKIGDLRLAVVYVWAQDDQDGTGHSWLVAEVMPLDHDSQPGISRWYTSITTANAYGEENEKAQDNYQARAATNGHPVLVNGIAGIEEDVDDDDDDDYWAQYDRTPGRTPAAPRSPTRRPEVPTEHRGRSASEVAYFERYAGVQPEMDSNDPSQDQAAIGTSSLDGNVMLPSSNRRDDGTVNHVPHSSAYERPAHAFDSAGLDGQPSTSPVPAVGGYSRLSGAQTESSASETAIKQHISTSIKSLFRLCRGAGIERSEFEEMINTELETLSLLAEDD